MLIDSRARRSIEFVKSLAIVLALLVTISNLVIIEGQSFNLTGFNLMKGKLTNIKSILHIKMPIYIGPPANKSNLKEVSASEIIKKIESGNDVYYYDTFINGNLIINSRKTNSHIVMLHCIIGGLLVFQNSTFESLVRFEETKFNEGVFLTNTKFNKSSFRYSAFDGYADLSKSVFRGETDFSNTRFRYNADFQKADFMQNANFREAEFRGPVDFSKTIFSNYTNFQKAIFIDNAFFKGSEFGRTVYFNNTTFNAYANFQNARFHGDADFKDSEFVGEADFEKCSIDGNLFLINSKISLFFVEWDSIKEGLSHDGMTYIKLIKNFKDIERFEDADNCYYQYRKWKQDQKHISWSKLMDAVAWVSCGYGVRPSYTLFWSFALIILFGSLFWLGNGISISTTLNNEPGKVASWYTGSLWKNTLKIKYHISFIRLKSFARLAKKIIFEPRLSLGSIHQSLESIRNKYFIIRISPSNAIYFSTMTFISRSPQHWLPRGKWKYVVMVESILGWLLLALFIVTLTKVMIRY